MAVAIPPRKSSYQLAISGLPAASVVGRFDPGHDRDAQLLLRCPGAAVEDIFLQRAGEGFQRIT